VSAQQNVRASQHVTLTTTLTVLASVYGAKRLSYKPHVHAVYLKDDARGTLSAAESDGNETPVANQRVDSTAKHLMVFFFWPELYCAQLQRQPREKCALLCKETQSG
jgi:hypothetical protein